MKRPLSALALAAALALSACSATPAADTAPDPSPSPSASTSAPAAPAAFTPPPGAEDHPYLAYAASRAEDGDTWPYAVIGAVDGGNVPGFGPKLDVFTSLPADAGGSSDTADDLCLGSVRFLYEAPLVGLPQYDTLYIHDADGNVLSLCNDEAADELILPPEGSD